MAQSINIHAFMVRGAKLFHFHFAISTGFLISPGHLPLVDSVVMSMLFVTYVFGLNNSGRQHKRSSEMHSKHLGSNVRGEIRLHLRDQRGSNETVVYVQDYGEGVIKKQRNKNGKRKQHWSPRWPITISEK